MRNTLRTNSTGTWRWWGAIGIFGIALAPALPLFWQAFASRDGWLAGRGFPSALFNSFQVALAVAALSLLIGLPLGVATALYEFPGRGSLLAVVTMPILVPSFLWAIGWSALTAHLGPDVTAALSGHTGCVVVLLAAAIPLVLWVCHAATRNISGSQIEAARLAGGERTVLKYAIAHVAFSGVLVASLAGVLTLADPGPGLILGLRTAASEILTSFAARYDFNLAGRQCVYLTLAVLMLAIPMAIVAAPRLTAELLPRQVRSGQRSWHASVSWVLALGLFAVGLAFVILPWLGLSLPLTQSGHWSRALQEVRRTWLDTVIYAVGAGSIATILGFLLGFFAGKNHRLQVVSLGVALALFAIPPSQASLGVIYLSTNSPAWTDDLLRSRLTVCFALSIRFFPIAVVLGMRAWNSMSPSWAQAAYLHGVSPVRYGRMVVIPFLAPHAAIAGLLIALLATAEIGTVLLLQPPGHGSFPLAIFTVMANAPEGLVASLCFLYLVLATILLTGVFSLARRRLA
ncbi:MAG: hypothetical protein L0Y72_17865 [Gemmataceae bacterium]|nr:hypothetical protein [Gemmataceae bacterium]MCI0740917.1 hypothetical protein [Gemmataceae bacterium]